MRYWKTKSKLEFFVDFETVNNADDDFSKFPYFNSDAQIFMIGCGYEDVKGDWQIEVFTADKLNLREETKIIKEWLSFMRKITDQILRKDVGIPRIFHWSPAEVNFMRSACKNQEKM